MTIDKLDIWLFRCHCYSFMFFCVYLLPCRCNWSFSLIDYNNQKLILCLFNKHLLATGLFYASGDMLHYMSVNTLFHQMVKLMNF